jgi:hypothetical protein
VWRMTRSEECTLAIQKFVEFGRIGVKELGHVILPNLLRGSPVDQLILPVSHLLSLITCADQFCRQVMQSKRKNNRDQAAE